MVTTDFLFLNTPQTHIPSFNNLLLLLKVQNVRELVKYFITEVESE